MRPSRIPCFLLIFLVICTLTAISVSKSTNGKDKDKEDSDSDESEELLCGINNKNKKEKDGKSSKKGKTLEGKDLLPYLTTKRPYNDKDIEKEIKGMPGLSKDCKAMKLWYFGRHGTRNPGKKDTGKMLSELSPLRDKIVGAHSDCKGSLSEKQIKKLKKWKLPSNVTLPNESNLVKQGMKELKGIGKRFRKRFPQLFSPVDPSKMRIRSTKSQRTEASAKAFLQGALDTKEVPKGFLLPGLKADPILKFYEVCSKWSEEVDENSESTPELKAFEISEIMNNTRAKVGGRLGLEKEAVSLGELTLMYTTCAFETAWEDGKASAWCGAFDENDLKVMAYREDLEYYWKDGYGYEVNYEQACNPLKDMIEFLKSNSSEAVSAYFSHSGATLKMLARLGLFNDSGELTSGKFEEVKDSYEWRTSEIDMMATNMAFVLYNCGESESQEDLQVGFLFQEKATKIPMCGNWICGLEEFEKGLKSRIGNCEFNKICGISKSSST